MLLLAAMAAAALGLTLQVLGDYLVETVYGSEKRQVQRLQETIDSFRTYVREEEVASTNVEKIGGWNREHPLYPVDGFCQWSHIKLQPVGSGAGGLRQRPDLSRR